MKRILLPALLLVSLLLTGCGSRALKTRFTEFSDTLAARQTLRYEASIRAEYPDRRADFKLRYEKDAEGERVTVLEPALIAGLSARIAPGSDALVYDGMILDAGPLDAFGLTPMSALPRLTEALCAGFLDSVWEEDGLTAAQLIPDDEQSVTVWFDGGMRPVRAELASGGETRVFCEITDWS